MVNDMRAQHRRLEAGFSTTVQGLFYTVLLWWSFGLVFDLGGAAYVSARLRSAAMSAAQDAAKYVDVAEIYRSDRLQIDAGPAQARARAVFARAMSGIPSEIAVSVQSGVLRDFVVVDARAVAPMRILRGFGMRDLVLSTHFAAEAVPGIEREYE
jgi:hypothetical protein